MMILSLYFFVFNLLNMYELNIYIIAYFNSDLPDHFKINLIGWFNLINWCRVMIPSIDY